VVSSLTLLNLTYLFLPTSKISLTRKLQNKGNIGEIVIIMLILTTREIESVKLDMSHMETYHY
jgi:hypothetical protein